MRVHPVLGPGFLESANQNALAHELACVGLSDYLQKPLDVRYEGIVVGHFVSDMLVEGAVIIENKAVQTLAPAHEVQLVNYLTATGIDIGLLLNFGAPRLEYKREARVFEAKPATTNLVHPVDPV